MKQFLILLGALAWFIEPAAAQKKPAPKAKSTTPAKASAAAKPAAALSPAALAPGKAVYSQYCLTCHQADGGGVDRMNAPLNQTSWVLGEKPRLVKVLLNGMQGVEIDGEQYANVMPAFDYLTDQQIADVLTYVRNSFGNKASAVSSAEVKAVRATNKK
ncbi:c-type cytochrome [Hymenobacter arizonensis]|uniref:Cytochrome c, mono-and diheme variants n=1 Tax=Hymenobacter arizonensis TaxID=1227077 RepID=A0A1I5URA7_HYMAR|nr:cytochrome c [Hymenobacter arizonensis]SFP97759.1 Cytochrome c, mono-and diheme variants [Hymenobacter arizonensis]